MSFIQINMISLATTIRSSIVVAGLIVSTGIRRQSNLILILRAVPGTVTWKATLEAQTIIGIGSISLGRYSPKGLPLRWRRQMRCNIGLSWCRCSWTIHAVGDPYPTLLR